MKVDSWVLFGIFIMAFAVAMMIYPTGRDTLASIQNSPRPTATNIFYPTARPKPTIAANRIYLPVVIKIKERC